MMSEMNDSHRLFLQAILSHGIFNSTQVLEFYTLACQRIGETADKDQLGEFVQTINLCIKPLSLEIKKGIGEHNGKSYYTLVNTSEQDITRLSSHYTANELEYFKKLVEIILDSDAGTVSSTKALNLGSTMEKKMNVQEVQELINKLEHYHWVEEPETKRGHICLSTRAIMELTHYMETQFPTQVVKCNLCKKLCLQGQNCSRCDARLHHFCAGRFFKDQAEPHCPVSNCGAAWPHTLPQVIPGAEPTRGGRRSPSKSAGSSGRPQDSQPSCSRRSSRHH